MKRSRVRSVRNLAAIESENVKPKRRREGALPGLSVDLANQIRHLHLTGMSDLLQAAPKSILKSDARIVTVEID